MYLTIVPSGEVDIDRVLNIQGFSAERMRDLMEVGPEGEFCKPISIKRLGTAGKGKKAPSATSRSKRIQTCSLVLEEPLDFHRTNEWLVNLLKTRGQDLYRLKGMGGCD